MAGLASTRPRPGRPTSPSGCATKGRRPRRFWLLGCRELHLQRQRLAADQILALAGIVITVVLAAAGFLVAKKVRRKSVTMKLTARDGGVGYQAAGDLTARDVSVHQKHD